jgi:hypothetical protein
MKNWIPHLLIFLAGVAGGVVATSLGPYLSVAKKRRTELMAARTRILTGIKEKHGEEILEEAFRTTEAIRGDLNNSLQMLRKMMHTVIGPVGDGDTSSQPKPIVQLSDSIKTDRPPS